jgi:propanol-preferring alcohol dehydrogenase
MKHNCQTDFIRIIYQCSCSAANLRRKVDVMMKAYRFPGTQCRLELKDVPVPIPGPNQVLLAVKAAGLCHSDTHFINGVGNVLGKIPITLGHEVAGTIVTIGSNVSGVQIGDKVAVAQIYQPIHATDRSKSIGVGYDGGYAEFAVADVNYLVQIPDLVTFAQAAVATDSIATAYHAVIAEAGIMDQHTVAIIGLGGLGLNAVKIASLRGAKVYGIDIDRRKYVEAQRQGAIACFTRLDKGTVSELQFDVIIDFAGVDSTLNDAITSVKLGGRVVLVGLGALELRIDSKLLVTRGIEVRGSIGASLDELREVLKLLAEGHIIPILSQIEFSKVAQGLERLERGEVIGRLFTVPNPRC